MDLREFLKHEKTSVAWLSKTANVPYTTVSEIVNKKIDIQKVQFGTVLRICKALELSTDQLFDLCVVNEKGWKVYIEENEYYMSYYFGNEKKVKKLCKYTPANSKYINAMAECYYEEIMCGKEIET